MAESKAEAVMRALAAALAMHLPRGVLFRRNDVVPTRIPPAGWLCLQDGDPGEPEVLLSPLTYIYEHRAELDVVVELPVGEREAVFDALRLAVGVAIAADRTLGGLCDYVLGEAPAPVEVPIEGGSALKAATIGILLTYETSDPLA